MQRNYRHDRSKLGLPTLQDRARDVHPTNNSIHQHRGNRGSHAHYNLGPHTNDKMRDRHPTWVNKERTWQTWLAPQHATDNQVTREQNHPTAGGPTERERTTDRVATLLHSPTHTCLTCTTRTPSNNRREKRQWAKTRNTKRNRQTATSGRPGEPTWRHNTRLEMAEKETKEHRNHLQMRIEKQNPDSQHLKPLRPSAYEPNTSNTTRHRATISSGRPDPTPYPQNETEPHQYQTAHRTKTQQNLRRSRWLHQDKQWQHDTFGDPDNYIDTEPNNTSKKEERSKSTTTHKATIHRTNHTSPEITKSNTKSRDVTHR